jgi:DNA mismatch repair ATPase MutS
MNQNLLKLKQYIEDILPKMDYYLNIIREKKTYELFYRDLFETRTKLETIYDQHFNTIPSYVESSNLYYMKGVGSMLQLYYQLFTQDIFKTIMEYSFHFHGYTDIIRVLSYHWKQGSIQSCTFTKQETQLTKQYYVAFLKQRKQTQEIVTNTVNLTNNIVITGPNASGKTTMLKTSLLNIIFSQQFGMGCYTSATIFPYHEIHSYLNIPDTSERDSLFQAESRRCKEILDRVKKFDTKRHLCIFDELYSGTNSEDAIQASTSFLTYISSLSNIRFLLTTHYSEVCIKLRKNKKIELLQMKTEIDDEDTIHYTYQLVEGISMVKGGYSVLKEMDYPIEILTSMKSNNITLEDDIEET